MKTAIIKYIDKIERSAMPGLVVTQTLIQGEKLEVSDGYHTMDELYEHRIVLFIALCKAIYTLRLPTGELSIWRSKLHNDGSEFEGWFILGIMDEPGKQITYHLPLRYWEETNFADTRSLAPVWDNHTSQDVLERLKKL
jgi:hypothetical protein